MDSLSRFSEAFFAAQTARPEVVERSYYVVTHTAQICTNCSNMMILYWYNPYIKVPIFLLFEATLLSRMRR